MGKAASEARKHGPSLTAHKRGEEPSHERVLAGD